MIVDEVLTIKDVATLLKLADKTVYSMAQQGELPAFKVRGQWRFKRADMDGWMEERKSEAPPPSGARAAGRSTRLRKRGARRG